MTTRRRLTITMTPDWRAALRQAGKAGQADRYQGETLNFESPGAFFGRLTELGLVERDDAGGVLCPYADVHIDMHVQHGNLAA